MEIHNTRIYRNKSKNDWTKYNLQIPEIDLSEPLSKMVKYIFSSIQKNKNPLFKNKFNEQITYLLERIDKINV